MNFLLALAEITVFLLLVLFDVSLGYSHGHKVEMPLNIFLLSVSLKPVEWLIAAGFITTIMRIKYIRAIRRNRKILQAQPIPIPTIVQPPTAKPVKKIDPGKFGLKLQWYSAIFAGLFGLNLFTWSYYGTYSVNPFISSLVLYACPVVWLAGMLIKYRSRSKAK